jgi:hypothetical protein
VKYEEWLTTVPSEITDDNLWRMEVYRQAVFAGDLAWHDASNLAQKRPTIGLADQLYRSVCSVSGNIAEGYSRQSGKDRPAFMNMLWVQLVKLATGTTMRDILYQKLWQTTESDSSPISFACCSQSSLLKGVINLPCAGTGN